jgi:hypothetical protein
MTVNVLCPACLTQREIDDQYIGRRANCGVCKFVYTLIPDTKDDWPLKLNDNPFLSSSMSAVSQATSPEIRDAIVVDDGKFVVTCKCQKRMKVPLHAQGKSIQCPACKQAITVEFLHVAEAFWEDSAHEGGLSDALAYLPLNQDYGNYDSAFGVHTAVQTKSLVPRKSRTYVHTVCGGATTIDGPDFAVVSNPLDYMKRSYCAVCENQFPVSELRWQDTNETIASYYERHRRNVSPIVNAIAKRSRGFFVYGGLLWCIILGLMIGLFRDRSWYLVLTFFLGIGGIVAAYISYEFLLKTFVYEAAFGTRDTRELT